MKKIYKAPLTKVVKIKAEKMLIQSNVEIGDSLPGGQSGNVVESKDYDDDDAFDDLW